MTRRPGLLLIMAMTGLLGACSGAGSLEGAGELGAPGVTWRPPPVRTSHPPWTTPTTRASPTPLLDVDQLLAGGPPPDGIPAIDVPRFQPVSEVDWLEDSEPVLSLTVGQETRAYPLRVMTWHEIVNDVVGGAPVAVTYCPLCNSGVAFERRCLAKGSSPSAPPGCCTPTTS